MLSIFIFLFYILLYNRYKPHKITTPDEALAELLQGNKEYNSYWNFITRANRKSVAMVQRPFAIALSCSDSRVPTEIIFNQLNLGNLFIVRNAGNIADGVVLGSIEYGISELGASLILVLGHERCGAVTATINSILKHTPEPAGHVKNIIKAIRPAAHTILNKYNNTDTLNEEMKIKIINETVQENIKSIIQHLLEHSEIIANAVANKKVKIVGAYYDLDDGNVHIIA